MLDNIISFMNQYKYIIIFYAVVALWIYLHRSKIDVQAKVIFLYRTKWGLKWMESFSKKYREWVILWGYIGSGVGFLGMIFISYILFKNLYDVLFTADAVNGVAVVLPGVNVPGLGVLPFWHWLIAIFLIAVVHEFSHGIVARAHKIPVHHSGIVFFGPILGAFVEPDEKKMAKEQDIKQYSVLAAGAWSNILMALVAVALLMFVFTPLQTNMVDKVGFTFEEYVSDDLPFAQAGIEIGTIISGINGVPTLDFQSFATELQYMNPGDSIQIETNKGDIQLKLDENPDDERKPFLGIKAIKNEVEVKSQYNSGVTNWLYLALDWWNSFLRWLFILSLGIGLFNLLPLPIVDGGRMMQIFCQELKGLKKGNVWYGRISGFLLLVLLANLVIPFLMGLF